MYSAGAEYWIKLQASRTPFMAARVNHVWIRKQLCIHSIITLELTPHNSRTIVLVACYSDFFFFFFVSFFISPVDNLLACKLRPRQWTVYINILSPVRFIKAPIVFYKRFLRCFLSRTNTNYCYRDYLCCVKQSCAPNKIRPSRVLLLQKLVRLQYELKINSNYVPV